MHTWITGLLCALMLIAAPASAEKIPVILDTDLGDDIDDTWALMMMLGSPELDLKLICTASDDTPAKTRLVAKMLERIGRTDIPIGTGPKTGDRPLHQASWLGDYTLDEYKGTVHKDGVQAAIDVIQASPTPVTLVVIGPQTNLMHMLERAPAVAENAKVVSMAGSVYIGYEGEDGRDPEWNVHRDVPAARAVFSAPWEIVLAPLDTCGTLVLEGDLYRKVVDADTPAANVLIENYDEWSNRKNHPENSSSVLFDTEAVYLAWDDALCEMDTVNLVIDNDGNTVPDPDGRPVQCALDWKDKDAFLKLVVERVLAAP